MAGKKKLLNTIMSYSKPLTFFIFMFVLYACTVKGADSGSYNGYSWQLYDSLNSGLPYNFLRAVAVGPNGEIWTGTFDAGVVKYDGDSWSVYSTDNSLLQSNAVWDIEFDRNGILWVGTGRDGIGGLARFDGDTWTVYDSANSPMRTNLCMAIAVDSNNTIWIGAGHATEGGLMSFDGSSWELFTPDNSPIPCRIIDDIIVESDNTKWIGMGMFQGNGGLARLEGQEWSIYTRENSIMAYNAVNNLSLDTSQNIWFSVNYLYYDIQMDSIRAFLIKYDGGTFSEHNPWLANVVSNEVSALVHDLKGRLWVATAGNLFVEGALSCLDGDTWTRFAPSVCGFPDVYIKDIDVDKDNRLWLGTGSGLIVLSEDDSAHVNSYRNARGSIPKNTNGTKQVMYNVRGQLIRNDRRISPGIYFVLSGKSSTLKTFLRFY